MSTELITSGRIQGISVNRVLRNTYWLLSLTIAFAALTSGISMAMKLPHPGLLLTLAGYFGLLFLTSHYRNSALGLVCVFALTGFMGYTLGPILNAYIGMAGGAQIVGDTVPGGVLVLAAQLGFGLAQRQAQVRDIFHRVVEHQLLVAVFVHAQKIEQALIALAQVLEQLAGQVAVEKLHAASDGIGLVQFVDVA